MTLNKENAASLLEKLEYFCKYKGIELPKSKSLSYIELAGMVIRRYGSIVLVEDNGTKYLCNNPKYLKRWALGQQANKAGSAYRMGNCGKLAKDCKRHNQTL